MAPPQELVERVLAEPISRRTINTLFLAGAGGLLFNQHSSQLGDLQTRAECAFIRSREGPSKYDQVEKYREGINYNMWFKEELIASGQASDPLPIQKLQLDEGELFKGILTLNSPEYLILEARGTKTPDRRIQVLDINLNNGSDCIGENYYHVIPDLKDDKKSTTTLYERKSGEYLVSIKSTDFSYDIKPEDLDLKIMAFRTDSPIFRTIIRRIPRVHLRQDNLDRITRNMPVANPWMIGETSDGLLYQIEHGEFLLGQEKGRDLCIADKPQDNEVFAFDRIAKASGLLVMQAGQEGIHHEMVEYPLPNSPYEITSDSPVVDLVIFTKNNIPSRSPEYFTHRMVSPFDDFLPMTESVREARETMLIANAWQERSEKGEIGKQRVMVQRFIQERLGGESIIHI